MTKPDDIPHDVDWLARYRPANIDESEWNAARDILYEAHDRLEAEVGGGSFIMAGMWAALIEASTRAIMAEREACAALADARAAESDPQEQDPYDEYEMGCRGTARRLALAIRNRGAAS